MTRLEEIREREQKATQGEWEHMIIDDATGVIDHTVDSGRDGVCCGISNPDDGNFIAHAREDIPFLLDQLTAMTARAEQAEAEREAATEFIKELREDDRGDWDYLMFRIDKWRGGRGRPTMIKKLKVWLAQLRCNHISAQLVRWHWNHGINGNDPATVEAEYRCDRCGKLVYMHLDREESHEWAEAMGRHRQWGFEKEEQGG